MKIMSFNLLWGGIGSKSRESRAQAVTKTILLNSPDLLGVQEATPEWMQLLTSSLPGFGHVGVGRDDGACKGEYSAIFYRTDEFDILNSGTFWLSDTPDVPSKGWDGACPRICTWAELRGRKSGKEFVYMNAHTDHKGPAAKENGVRLLTEKAASLSHGLPVFISGDFNAELNDSAIKIIKAFGFYDIRDLAKRTDYSITWHSYGREPGKILDYIFTNSKYLSAESFRTIKDTFCGILPSDHYPIMAEIIL